MTTELLQTTCICVYESPYTSILYSPPTFSFNYNIQNNDTLLIYWDIHQTETRNSKYNAYILA